MLRNPTHSWRPALYDVYVDELDDSDTLFVRRVGERERGSVLGSLTSQLGCETLGIKSSKSLVTSPSPSWLFRPSRSSSSSSLQSRILVTRVNQYLHSFIPFTGNLWIHIKGCSSYRPSTNETKNIYLWWHSEVFCNNVNPWKLERQIDGLNPLSIFSSFTSLLSLLP